MTSIIKQNQTKPAAAELSGRFGRIPAAVRRCGLSRRFLYDLAKLYPGLFRKAGAATIVDFQFLDVILAGMPAAKIGRAATSFPAAPSLGGDANPDVRSKPRNK